MYTILFLTGAFVIIIITIYSTYYNRGGVVKKNAVEDITVPPIIELPPLEEVQMEEITDVIIQPIDENRDEHDSTEPSVIILRHIKTSGKDEYYQEKLLSQNWKDKVEQIKRKNGYQCQKCFGLTILSNIEEIRNFVDYPEVGDAVVDTFNRKEQLLKPGARKYKVSKNEKNGVFYITKLNLRHIALRPSSTDIITTNAIETEMINGYYNNESHTEPFRYNVKDPTKKSNILGVNYFEQGNTNNQLILRNIEWYNNCLPYAKQGIVSYNEFSIVFPLLTIKKEYLEVHHLAYYEGLEPWECPEKELVTLCHKCHMKAHEQEIPVKRIVK